MKICKFAELDARFLLKSPDVRDLVESGWPLEGILDETSDKAHLCHE